MPNLYPEHFHTFSNKSGFQLEDIEGFFKKIHYKSLSWAENLNKLFTVLGGKFKFSAQDSDLEYLFWEPKFFQVSSELKFMFSKKATKNY